MITGNEGLDTRAGIDRVSHHVDLDKDYYEMDPELLRETFLEDLDGILVFTNLPKVKQDKYNRLQYALKKKLAERDVIWDEDIEDFVMPISDEPQEINENNIPEGKTHGLAFMEFKNNEKASRILNELNGQKFDKQRNWSIQRWTDWLESDNIDEEFVPPSFEDFQSSEPVRQWLEDQEGRDQFLVRWLDRDNHKTALYWGDHRRGGMDLVTDFGKTIARAGKAVFCVNQAEFSPLGSFVLTRHDQGLKIWSQGRDNFWNTHCTLVHPGVTLWEWSPQENFVLTFNGDEDAGKGEEIVFWNLEDGSQCRRFPSGFARAADLHWPYFQFSHDDQFFGWLQSSKFKQKQLEVTRNDADKITVFSTHDFRKIAKKSLQTPNRTIRRLEFNPGRNLLGYVTTNTDNVEVTIRTVPERENVGGHTYAQPIKGVSLIWHPSGDFLCVKVVKLLKKRRGKKDDNRIDCYDLTIFNCNYDQKLGKMPKFPNMNLGKAQVLDIKWEPTAPRVCVLQCKETHGGTRIRIFDVSNRVKERFDENACPNWSMDLTTISWSPTGRHLVLSNCNDRVFFDTEYEKYVHRVHNSAQEVLWDPSGRFVVSIVATEMDEEEENHYGGATDNAWLMYNFQGDEIAKHEYKGFQSKDNCCLYTFQWRPRPKTLLNEDAQADILKNLKNKYWDDFERSDLRILTDRSSAEVKERLQKKQEWEEIFTYLQELAEEFRQQRLAFRDGVESEDEDEFEIEETTEEEITRKLDEEVTIDYIQNFNG